MKDSKKTLNKKNEIISDEFAQFEEISNFETASSKIVGGDGKNFNTVVGKTRVGDLGERLGD
ncbi:MAG: hypothetical protein GQ574_13780 [Crocinitomix sp.]|nr:hypothetical protein [Crocinitomix sp.]